MSPSSAPHVEPETQALEALEVVYRGGRLLLVGCVAMGLVFLALGGFYLSGDRLGARLASLLLGMAIAIGGLAWLGRAALLASEKVQLYEKGFVYYWGGEATVCRWDQVRDVQYQLTRHFNGGLNFTTDLFIIHLHDGTTLRLSSSLAKVRELGHRILTQTGRPIPFSLLGAGQVMFRPVTPKIRAYELASVEGGEPSHPVTAAVLRATLEGRPEFTVTETEANGLELTACPASLDAIPGAEAVWNGGNGRLTLRIPEPSPVQLEQLQLEADNDGLTAACCQALRSVFGPFRIRVRGASLWLEVPASGDTLRLDLVLQRFRLDYPTF